METSTSTTSTATSCSFLCMPDGGYPDPLECDFWKQDCREGQKCAPWASDGGGAWNSTKCVPVDPDPDGLHEPCTVEGSGVSGIDSCDKGAMCWNVDPRTNMGFCIALCQGDEAKCTEDPESCCPEWSTCYGSASGVHNLCFQTCDPWIQNCEYYKEGCYPHGVGFWCAPFQPGDGGVVGDPCSQDSECDPGTYCGDSSAHPKCDPNVPGCCTPFCSLMAPDCIDGAECLPWFDPMDPPWGYEDLGACAIP